MKMFCKHDWEIKDKTILPANLELLESTPSEGSIPQRFFVKKLVLIMACKKCGKLFKSVEEN
jgi:hypothetical protein